MLVDVVVLLEVLVVVMLLLKTDLTRHLIQFRLLVVAVVLVMVKVEHPQVEVVDLVVVADMDPIMLRVAATILLKVHHRVILVAMYIILELLLRLQQAEVVLRQLVEMEHLVVQQDLVEQV